MSVLSEKIIELKAAINAELEFCNSADTPYVCQMTETPEGKTKVVTQIVQLVGKRGFTIGRAIAELEEQVNPNFNE